MTTVTLDEALLRQANLGNFFRPSQTEALGITYNQLRRLETDDVVERVGRGLYRLADAEPTEHYSVASVCARVPRSIVCLLTALSVHDIGTHVPREVWIAIPHKARPPRLDPIKVRLVRFSGAAWTCGVLDIEFEGVPARITSPERTVVDCFRFERLIGREAAVETLLEALRDKKVTIDSLFHTLEAVPSRKLSVILESGMMGMI